LRELNLSSYELGELSSQVLGRGGGFTFRAQGSSMLPFILSGDLLTIEPAVSGELKVGQIALYLSSGNQVVVHRVVFVDVARKNVYFLGDAQAGGAEAAGFEQVLGRVVRVRRGRFSYRPDSFIPRLGGLAWMRLRPAGLVLLRAARRVGRLAG
jgi:hypothetical protein